MTRWKLVLYHVSIDASCLSAEVAQPRIYTERPVRGHVFKDRRGMDWEQTRVDGLPEFRPTLLKSMEKRNYRQLWIFLPIGIAHAHGFYGRDAACAASRP